MNKKKIMLIAIVGVLLVALIQLLGQGNTYSTKIELENASHYNEDELQSALRTVEKNFRKDYRGSKMTDLWYDDDYNETHRQALEKKYQVQKAIVVLSNIQTGRQGALKGKLDANKDYPGYAWILTKKNSKAHWTLVEATTKLK